ncbi:MAG: hypothetical protein LBC97_13150 [Bifidobacteriaceae bacterium]|nr:hypothetical protein [Bifidobacteriaceae bacterium]
MASACDAAHLDGSVVSASGRPQFGVRGELGGVRGAIIEAFEHRDGVDRIRDDISLDSILRGVEGGWFRTGVGSAG